MSENDQELETILQGMMNDPAQEGKSKFLEFHMDFDVAAIEVSLSLN